MKSNSPKVYSARRSDGHRASDLTRDEASWLKVSASFDVANKSVADVEDDLDAAVGDDWLRWRWRRLAAEQPPDAPNVHPKRWCRLDLSILEHPGPVGSRF